MKPTPEDQFRKDSDISPKNGQSQDTTEGVRAPQPALTLDTTVPWGETSGQTQGREGPVYGTYTGRTDALLPNDRDSQVFPKLFF